MFQEPKKGGFSKGGFCRVQRHFEGNKKGPRTLAPAVHLALRASQPREAYILQKPPSKNPLFLFPEYCGCQSEGGGGVGIPTEGGKTAENWTFTETLFWRLWPILLLLIDVNAGSFRLKKGHGTWKPEKNHTVHLTGQPSDWHTGALTGHDLGGHESLATPLHENGKTHPKKICIKNFGGTLAGGSRRGLRRPNSFMQVLGIPSRIQCIKNFEGGGV